MPKIGNALKKAVELKPQVDVGSGSRKGPASPLMNANRRAIFQFLCFHPCSRMDRIASNVSLSRSSTSWHLGCLIETGYVRMFPDKKTKRYYPLGLISNSNLKVHSVLGEDDCLSVFRAAVNNPGADRGHLAGDCIMPTATMSACLKNLLETGMVTRVMDGRHARYFPTEKYRDVLRDDRTAGKEFIRLLIRKMSDEHLSPELADLKGSNLAIEIKVNGQKEKFEVPQQILPSFIAE